MEIYWSWTVFTLGAMGASAAEIVRLYKAVRHWNRKIPGYLRYAPYYVVSGVFATLGGIMAIILESTTAWAAFYAGLSTPVVISAATSQVSSLMGPEKPQVPPKETDDELFQKVKTLIIEQLGVEEEKVTPEARFKEDLEADELDLVELVMAFEEDISGEISDEEAQVISTVGEAVAYIDKHLSAERPPAEVAKPIGMASLVEYVSLLTRP